MLPEIRVVLSNHVNFDLRLHVPDPVQKSIEGPIVSVDCVERRIHEQNPMIRAETVADQQPPSRLERCEELSRVQIKARQEVKGVDAAVVSEALVRHQRELLDDPAWLGHILGPEHLRDHRKHIAEVPVVHDHLFGLVLKRLEDLVLLFVHEDAGQLVLVQPLAAVPV